MTTLLEGSALIVVDLQNGFCHADGARSRLLGPGGNLAAEAIAEPAVRAVRLCRAAGLPVWFTRMVDLADGGLRVRRRLPTMLDRLGLRIDLCPAGSWDAELLDVVAAEVAAPEEVIVKHRASAFYATTLEVALRTRAIETVLVCGTTTSYCVASTLFDAEARDFNVVLLADATADSRAEAHDAILATVSRDLGIVATVDDLERLLAPVPA